jgi:transaldolase/glucose-6-phosphate isomerase
MNKLKQLEMCGQSLWLDYLRRSLIENGELLIRIERDGVKGVTSNPSIFEKAIGETDEYTNALKAFQAQSDHYISAIYEHLAISDIRAAADVLRPVYDQTRGRDGYISLECSPYLADDTEATVAEARRLWATVARPNAMIKVPATPAGIPAIRQLIARGVNVNITLLFSSNVYEQVVNAYISGLEDFAQASGDVSKVASVASIFVSRIDTAIDKRLEALGDTQAARLLRGKIGIANAKLVYARYKVLFATPRWQSLAVSGARTQRLLWASTGVKNTAYKDTMYVEALIGRDTVVTVPPATMDAFRDHGDATPDAIEQDVEGACATLAALEDNGVSLDEVTEQLVVDGVQRFADAFDKLFGALARQRDTLLEGDRPVLEIKPGSAEMKAAFDAELIIWGREGRIRRLWAGDKSLWPGAVEEYRIRWLHIAEPELTDMKQLHGFANEIKQRGFSGVVLLGIGGPILGSEVLGEALGRRVGKPHIEMMGSTDSVTKEMFGGAVDLAKTLLIVASSTSGSTLAFRIFGEYLFGHVRETRDKDKAYEHFIGMADANFWFERSIEQLRCAHLFQGASAIGDGYALRTKFGMVAAPAIELDVIRFLETTRQMERACGPDVPAAYNPGVQLGVFMGIAASRFGRDKVTITVSPETSALGAWLEQLLTGTTAEGEGKLIRAAKDVVSIAQESNRLFVFFELDGKSDLAQQEAMAALERDGHPIVHIHVKDIWHIGQEFFRWEIAAAIAFAVTKADAVGHQDNDAGKASLRR